MTENKRNFSFKRVVLLTAVIVMLLVIVSISVNAATEGKFFDSVQVYFNNVLMKGTTNTYTDESGNKVEEYVVDLGDGNSFIVSSKEAEGETWNGMEIRSEITTDSSQGKDFKVIIDSENPERYDFESDNDENETENAGEFKKFNIRTKEIPSEQMDETTTEKNN